MSMSKCVNMCQNVLRNAETSSTGRIMHEVLKLTEVCQLVNMSRRTLYRMIKDGRFPVRPIPGTKPPRWSKAAVIEWTRSCSQS